MGNNFCQLKIESEKTTISQLICEQKLNDCNIFLTIGKIENEYVDCVVQLKDDQFQKAPVEQQIENYNENCVFIKSTRKNLKSQIFVYVKNLINGQGFDEEVGENQTIYKLIQSVLKMADEKQMKSIAFPVFYVKNYTTSATIMLMAIKEFIVEQFCQRLTKIYIILNSLEQISSFKWGFEHIFNIKRRPSTSYESSIYQDQDYDQNNTNQQHSHQQFVKGSVP